MNRYRMLLEYDGSPYKGWQRQGDVPSVQGALEDALARLGEEGALVHGSGRTDAGVHAFGQVAHFDIKRKWDSFRLMEGLNAQLRQEGEKIALLACNEEGEEFHARFCAVKRHYLYRIICRRAPLILEEGRAWNVKKELDVKAMSEAARLLRGKHDFTTFRSSECQAQSPIKTLDALDVTQTMRKDESAAYIPVIEIRASARSFLHNQVRSLAGALKIVGEKRWSEKDLAQALEAKDRKKCPPIAPPHGLYLAQVDY